jgi:hypothetical protein
VFDLGKPDFVKPKPPSSKIDTHRCHSVSVPSFEPRPAPPFFRHQPPRYTRAPHDPTPQLPAATGTSCRLDKTAPRTARYRALLGHDLTRLGL